MMDIVISKYRNRFGLDMKLFRNNTSMTKTAEVLMNMIEQKEEKK